MKNPLISVIVPVYNAEEFLPRCINSILAQTFTDFELLLIDDGSTDNSRKICQEYAKNDNRIRVFHKENGGVSSARNVGIDNAQGEWICFCDADDELMHKMLKNIATCNKDCDFILFDSYGINYKGYKTILPMDLQHGYVDCNELTKKMLVYKVQTSPWARAFKLGKISTLRYNTNLKIGEDLLFNLEYIHNLGENAVIYYNPEITYIYNYVQTSVIHNKTILRTEYKKLSSVINFYVKTNYGSRYNQELAYFELINLLQSICASRQIPNKKDDKQILYLYSLTHNNCEFETLNYAKMLSHSRLFAHISLHYQYIKWYIRNIFQATKFR